MPDIDKAMPLSMSAVQEAKNFGEVEVAEEMLQLLSYIFASGMVAVALWVAWASI